MVNPTVLDYLGGRQASRQWKKFLAALALEFSGALPEADLRALMRRVGIRFAEQSALSRCETLDDAQRSMNLVWMDQDWGWATVDEQHDALRITHNCSPLHAAFGPHSSAWIAAFLEGVYQKWFEQLGAGSHLMVTQASEVDAMGCVELRLGR
ncbi:Cellulose synthase operon protein D [Pigmentiphaga humi]|uniref:Cellulose synthase operon protein D n=1 Tax=Pigmentiphaga humi TaxID=2478468 RepID=A0A3P4B763_9BURK|nr:cellulose biosynthesis protein BcsD [Pigmentiphaga humi]VCU72127.1 Cellulose synthase operon protein D [Pigmentiphaga humi]